MGILHVIGMTIVSYLLMALLPRKHQQSYVMAWCLGYLTVNHLYRMYTNFGGFDLDISTYTMLQVCKLSAIAFCYKDGGMKDEDLIPDQKERQVKTLPSIIEMCSYTWYVQNCALGVFFEFSDYKSFIERKGRYAQVSSPILPSLITLLKAIACTAFFLIGSQYYWVEFCFTSEFGQISFLNRVWYFYVAMSLKKFFYYGPFSFTTGAIQASGLGFSSNGKWDTVMGVYIWEVETADSVMTMLRAWNHQVHLWLKFYIQFRIVEKGKSPTTLQTIIVFVVSAFWHGFYPSYYVMFTVAAILSEVSKDIFRARVLF